MPSAPVPDPATRLALALIRLYKLFFSPLFAGSCRFLPSCADYAAEAITRFGILRGSALALWRLARCHPVCAGGHDPVPPLESAAVSRQSTVSNLSMPCGLKTAD